MNHRIIVGVLLGVAIAWCFTGFFILRQDIFKVCEDCFHSIIFSIGKPLYWGLRPVILSFAIILFVRKEILKICLWIALVMIPISILWLSRLPPLCSSIFCPDRTQGANAAGCFFLLIVCMITIYKVIKIRLGRNVTKY